MKTARFSATLYVSNNINDVITLKSKSSMRTTMKTLKILKSKSFNIVVVFIAISQYALSIYGNEHPCHSRKSMMADEMWLTC